MSIRSPHILFSTMLAASTFYESQRFLHTLALATILPTTLYGWYAMLISLVYLTVQLASFEAPGYLAHYTTAIQQNTLSLATLEKHILIPQLFIFSVTSIAAIYIIPQTTHPVPPLLSFSLALLIISEGMRRCYRFLLHAKQDTLTTSVIDVGATTIFFILSWTYYCLAKPDPHTFIYILIGGQLISSSIAVAGLIWRTKTHHNTPLSHHPAATLTIPQSLILRAKLCFMRLPYYASSPNSIVSIVAQTQNLETAAIVKIAVDAAQCIRAISQGSLGITSYSIIGASTKENLNKVMQFLWEKGTTISTTLITTAIIVTLYHQTHSTTTYLTTIVGYLTLVMMIHSIDQLHGIYESLCLVHKKANLIMLHRGAEGLCVALIISLLKNTPHITSLLSILLIKGASILYTEIKIKKSWNFKVLFIPLRALIKGIIAGTITSFLFIQITQLKNTHTQNNHTKNQSAPLSPLLGKNKKTHNNLKKN